MVTGSPQPLSQTLIFGVVSFCCRNLSAVRCEDRRGKGRRRRRTGKERMDEGVLLVCFCCSVDADGTQKGKLLFFITEQQPRKKATSLSHLQTSEM